MTLPSRDSVTGRLLEIPTVMRSVILSKFESRVAIRDSGCHEWIAARGSYGHGHFSIRDPETRVFHQYKASRVAWMLYVGSIPDRMWVLHHCDNPPCVNPEHLFIGNAQDNVDDMHKKGRGLPLDIVIARARLGRSIAADKKRSRTHCRYGHPYSGENLIVFTSQSGTPARDCKECRRTARKKYSDRKKTERTSP